MVLRQHRPLYPYGQRDAGDLLERCREEACGQSEGGARPLLSAGYGSHLFDTAMYFMATCRRVSARYVHEEGLHSWLIDCDFESGAIGTLYLTVAIAQQWHEGCEIYGTGGTVFAKTYNPWEFRSSEVSCFDKETELSTTPAAFDGQFYRRELEAFADTILN